MSAAWGAVGMGPQRLITIFLISVNCSYSRIYFCNTSSYRHKTDDQILSLDSCPSSRVRYCKTINFNNVTDEFATVTARYLHCKFSIVYKNINELILCCVSTL
jgi:hypothetical protein